MRAWRLHPNGDLRLDEVELPELLPGWAEVSVRRFQVSITEALALSGAPGIEHNLIREKLRSDVPNQLFGHEFTGEVTGINGDAWGLEPGHRVASLGKVPCLACDECRVGREARCTRSRILGIHVPGCFADSVRVPTHALVRLPETIDDVSAAALQPLSSCIACFRPAQAQAAHGSFAVLGTGTMGLFLVALAHFHGARVIALGRRAETLAAARRAGADVTALSGKELEAAVAELDPPGVDVVFEATGAVTGGEPFTAPLVDLAARIALPGGTVFEVSTFPGRIALDVARFRAKSLHYAFIEFASRGDLLEAVRLVEDKSIVVEVSHVFEGLESLPDAISATLSKSADGVIGSVQVAVSL